MDRAERHGAGGPQTEIRRGSARRARVLSLPVDPIYCAGAVDLVMEWANRGESRVVCAANVHMVMEAWDDSGLRERLEQSDLSVPDGMPLVWALRALGETTGHVRGADLFLEVCRRAQAECVPVGLYGSTPETLKALLGRLHQDFPSLEIPFMVSPPFRPLADHEQLETLQTLRQSGARVLLVGLGCPKQELWMLEQRGLADCVMLGVGAAFDFVAHMTPEAPRWMQRCGLEWVFRFVSEPRRLWRRYLKHNPRFVVLFVRQWLRHSWARSRPR
jgi:N-acetylglucosaminyldiphosphoundecaprenol N-acetyl-beta-D-mannosaminyltransferase